MHFNQIPRHMPGIFVAQKGVNSNQLFEDLNDVLTYERRILGEHSLFSELDKIDS